MLLGLTKIPEDFPRVYVGSRAVPVNFLAKGSLELGEQLSFESLDPGSDNGQRYRRIAPDLHVVLPYARITRVARYEAAEPTIKYFNLKWVRIHVSDPDTPSDLLLSSIGGGTQMKRIAQTNELLYQQLQAKTPAP